MKSVYVKYQTFFLGVPLGFEIVRLVGLVDIASAWDALSVTTWVRILYVNFIFSLFSSCCQYYSFWIQNRHPELLLLTFSDQFDNMYVRDPPLLDDSNFLSNQFKLDHSNQWDRMQTLWRKLVMYSWTKYIVSRCVN